MLIICFSTTTTSSSSCLLLVLLRCTDAAPPNAPSVQAGPGADDSIIYVVYHPSQCLPEFIVTYPKI